MISIDNEKKQVPTAERLREAMAEAGKKQIDLVKETGLQRSAVSRYLSGEYEPKQKAIHKMAVALNVNEMWLWGFDVPKARTTEQKKNDDLVQVIAKLRKDADFFDVVSILAELPETEYASVKQLLEVLRSRK